MKAVTGRLRSSQGDRAMHDEQIEAIHSEDMECASREDPSSMCLTK